MTPREMRLHWVGVGYDRGWSFTPLDGKRPRLFGWTKLPRETREQALAWAAAGNVGVRCGASSFGLLVIDVDTAKGATWECPVRTLAVRTGAGGRHHYFYVAGGGPVPNSSGRVAPHVDVRATGGQVVFPGSVPPGTSNIARQRLRGAEAALAAHDVQLAKRLLRQALDDMEAEDREAAPAPTGKGLR